MASRRLLLTAGAAGVGLAAAGAGLRETALRVAGGAGAPPRALTPEAWVDPATGAVVANPQQFMAHVACAAGDCGARLRVDRVTGRVLRITGNPYHPLSADPALPAATTLRAAIAALSRRRESGLAQRATVCARGAELPLGPDAPDRLRTPLKRVGPRGGEQWQPIGFEQLVREVVDGGDLFGEGKVEGLRGVGPVLLVAGHEDGRTGFARAVLGAFGNAALRVQHPPLPRPDLREAAFVIVFGSTLPGGLPGRQIAERRAAGKLVTVLIDAVLGPADNLAVGAASRWLPIRPGTEAVLARALIRQIGGLPAAAEDAASVCGVAEADIAALAKEFARHGGRAAGVASGPQGAAAAAALNALAGHAGPELPPEATTTLLLWGCDPAPALTAPLVVAAGTRLDRSMRQADYVVPDTLAYESWGCASVPGVGVTTAWPVVAPPAQAGMEQFLMACGRAMALPGVPDDATGWHLRAVAEAATAMPEISDDDLVLAGLDRIRPLLETTLGEPGWRRAAFVLARGGRFGDAGNAAPAARFDARVLAAAVQSVPQASAAWPLLLAVRAPLLPGRMSVALHAEDAAALQLRSGDAVTVETPDGRHAGRLLVRQGIMRGVVATSADLQDGSPARLKRT